MVFSQALWILAATSFSPKWFNIMMAACSSPEIGLAKFFLQDQVPNRGWLQTWHILSLILAEPASPTDPEIWAAISDITSPYKLGITTTSNRSGVSAILAAPMFTINVRFYIRDTRGQSLQIPFLKRPSCLFHDVCLLLKRDYFCGCAVWRIQKRTWQFFATWSAYQVSGTWTTSSVCWCSIPAIQIFFVFPRL